MKLSQEILATQALIDFVNATIAPGYFGAECMLRIECKLRLAALLNPQLVSPETFENAFKAAEEGTNDSRLQGAILIEGLNPS